MIRDKLFYLGDFFVNIKDKNDLINKINLSLIKTKNQPLLFFYLNSGSYYYLSSRSNYKKSMLKADYCYLNSFYIKRLFDKLGFTLEKINAEDFINDLFYLSQKKNKKIFLLGSETAVLEKAITNVKSMYKTLLIGGQDGFFKENNQPIKIINNFSPDILIVGLGSGYQETWIVENLSKFKKIKTIITVGNFIDVLGGERKIIPNWVKKAQLEWLYRLVKEPKRLWKRYLIGGFVSFYFFIRSLRLKRPQNYTLLSKKEIDHQS
ncbi:MAG: WecB/TagA/CpsF family glycosyltransferase [Patescibacteria group bacterium]